MENLYDYYFYRERIIIFYLIIDNIIFYIYVVYFERDINFYTFRYKYNIIINAKSYY